MSEVFIPLGGAGGKNRGEGVQVDENYTYLKMGTLGVGIPLPAGNYKALKAVHGEETPFSSYGDGKNAAVFMTKEFLKKVTLDYFGIASITNFKLTMYAHRQVRLTWKNPSMGLWSGVRFVFKYGSMPTSETDGFMFYDSADVHYETPKLEERELFVRAYSYVTVKDGRWYDDGAVSARITVSGISGSVTLSTGAGVWTVPDNVYKIRYILVGHGGDGTKFGYAGNGAGGGGGGGGYFTSGYLDVLPQQKISWTIPSEMGYATTFGNISSNSGKSSSGVINGIYRNYYNGGDGGSGGGGGVKKKNDSPPSAIGGAGGDNGSDGYGSVIGCDYHVELKFVRGGTGQGTSTRGFNGVLYSGGGAGKTWASPGAVVRVEKYAYAVEQSAEKVMIPNFDGSNYIYTKNGIGGEGGGGNGEGAVFGSNNLNGTDGLGGGGGGASYGFGRGIDYNSPSTGGKGGTGCIYIAWGSLMNDGS